ncbi:MAG TPA: bacillithiol system redox-active protein YtxJ [Pyrinomonadaceae bacterium]|nr:bacillithiol system redox-active protein YtxJ [Pyrinomonadaceae bacterium]
MGAKFIPVNDTAALDELVARSHDAPVILFKHSLTCPISATAYREMEGVGRDVGLVVVQKARPVSDEIEARTGVRHESPQALILRDGRVVWSATHWNVTAGAVGDAFEENSRQ